MGTVRRLAIIALTILSFGYAQAQDGIIAASVTTSTTPAKSVLFNFNATAQSVSGTVDVSGSPHSAVVTATDATTGWTITSVETATAGTWVNFGGASSSNTNGTTADDGGGFVFGSAVGKSTWYTSVPTVPNGHHYLQVSNLDVSKTYTIKILSSLSSSSGAPTNDTTQIQAIGAAASALSSIYQINNTSHTLNFTGISPASDGTIRFSFGATGTTTAHYAVINALKITEQ